MKAYFDNAATTRIDPRVGEAMMPFITGKFGNPSSTHSFGREVKAAIELSRKSIAERLGCTPGEIYFTSGGTESINTILNSAVRDLGKTTAITSPIEHHAVLHTLENLRESTGMKLKLVEVDSKGRIDLDHLELLLKKNDNPLVSLMFANNEIANVNPVNEIAALCAEYKAFFHSDTVQAMGHFPINLEEWSVDSAVCSAHKIHGPKGIGFMYLKKGYDIHSYILGGGQERNMRGGTENVIGIIGLAKAFEIATDEITEQKEYIQSLKKQMIHGLKEKLPGVSFNGLSDEDESLYTVLNVSLPTDSHNEMVLFQLDLQGISASGGSACNSGAVGVSHVLEALDCLPGRTSVRFSFSKYNSREEVDFAVKSLEGILNGSLFTT